MQINGPFWRPLPVGGMKPAPETRGRVNKRRQPSRRAQRRFDGSSRGTRPVCGRSLRSSAASCIIAAVESIETTHCSGDGRNYIVGITAQPSASIGDGEFRAPPDRSGDALHMIKGPTAAQCREFADHHKARARDPGISQGRSIVLLKADARDLRCDRHRFISGRQYPWSADCPVGPADGRRLPSCLDRRRIRILQSCGS